MDVAVDRLLKAFKEKQTIGVYADYDLDGSPGLALLVKGFRALGFPKVEFRQPLRLKDGYGVHTHLLKELKDLGVSLVVTVDVGITDVEAIADAYAMGLDVIVTDHHLPKNELPKALAIINPNKPECGSALGHLSGTGVAFYLLLALKSRFEKEGLDTSSFQAKSLLDLFALATVTDMVPLVKENRVLVKHGLRQLQEGANPGLRRLMGELGLLGRELSTQDISFKLAPKLNALSRLEEGLRPIDILLASEAQAKNLVQQVLAVNLRRKTLQAQAEQLAFDLLEKQKQASPFVFLVSADFHPGVVSVVANKVMEKTGRPTFLGAVRAGGHVVGSARSPHENLNLQDIFQKCQAGLRKFGGHAMAAGFETHVDQAEALAKSLADAFFQHGLLVHRQDLGDSQESNVYDAVLPLEQLGAHFMKWHSALEPFGAGFPAPVYKAQAVVKSTKSLKNGHFRYLLADPISGVEFEAPWFSAKRVFGPKDTVSLVFEPQWNHWNGQKRLQLMVQDMWQP